MDHDITNCAEFLLFHGRAITHNKNLQRNIIVPDEVTKTALAVYEASLMGKNAAILFQALFEGWSGKTIAAKMKQASKTKTDKAGQL